VVLRDIRTAISRYPVDDSPDSSLEVGILAYEAFTAPSTHPVAGAAIHQAVLQEMAPSQPCSPPRPRAWVAWMAIAAVNEKRLQNLHNYD
jgi:hypothetical protein